MVPIDKATSQIIHSIYSSLSFETGRTPSFLFMLSYDLVSFSKAYYIVIHKLIKFHRYRSAIVSENLVRFFHLPHRCMPLNMSITFVPPSIQALYMMTSSNGNILRAAGLLCGEFTGHRWIPRTKASDAKLWCFLWSAPEPTAEQTMDTLVFWDATALAMTSL